MTSMIRIAFSMTVVSATALAGCVEGDAEPPGDETGIATSESAIDCENGANGFIDISDSLSGTKPVPAVDLGAGVTLTLESGTVAGAQRGWARIHGATIPGDQVWMNWTVDNWAHIKVQCGPFTVASNGMSKTSAAKVTSSSTSYQFRACGRLSGLATHCTQAW